MGTRYMICRWAINRSDPQNLLSITLDVLLQICQVVRQLTSGAFLFILLLEGILPMPKSWHGYCYNPIPPVFENEGCARRTRPKLRQPIYCTGSYIVTTWLIPLLQFQVVAVFWAVGRTAYSSGTRYITPLLRLHLCNVSWNTNSRHSRGIRVTLMKVVVEFLSSL